MRPMTQSLRKLYLYFPSIDDFDANFVEPISYSIVDGPNYSSRKSMKITIRANRRE
ncbi:MAG: hypothetical protein ACJAZ1_001471 [Yoonia sp.]|jgi:hypothetical protein